MILEHEDLPKVLRAAAESGMSPREVFDLTPHECFSMFFREVEDESVEDMDRIEKTHRWNHEAANEGVEPSVPSWMFQGVPRVKR